MRQRWLHALFGVLATLAGVAVAHLIAAFANPAASPVLAVGSTVIDLTPTPLKEWAVRNFGTGDKTVLVTTVFVVVLLLSAVAGLVSRDHLRRGLAVLALLLVLAAAAVLTRPMSSAIDLLPTLAAALVGLSSLAFLHGLAAPTTPTGEDGQPSRRGVILAGLGLAIVAAAAGGIGNKIGRVRARISDISLPTSGFKKLPPVPTTIDRKVQGISTLQTPTDRFYRIDTRLSIPLIDPDTWTLTIDGDVDREVSFSYDDIRQMPLIERDITLTCVSNPVGGPYISNGRWLGVPLQHLLDQAGISHTKADQIFSSDADGFTVSTPLALATDGRDAMLAIGLNGEPLPRKHGFPARMVIPGLYGFISATKWVTRMTLTNYADQSAYWTDRGWATNAPIKPQSRVDTPAPLSTIKPGDTFIGGVAWAQPHGVEKVEVRIDGQAWQEAKLGPSLSDDTWRQWYLPWKATTGPHTLSCRVTSKNGDVQEAARKDVFPDGATGYESITVTVS